MANYFTLTLDTTAPTTNSISLAGGATYATSQVIAATLASTGASQMKIWGDVDTTYDNDVKATEGASNWITYATSKQIKLSTGDGSKTVNAKFRDDVYNECTSVNDSITLDTTLPVVTITGPDVAKISKVATKNVSSFSFSVDVIFDQYKVMYVASEGAANDTGTNVQIGTTGGSTNMSGSVGSYPASTPINCTIYGADLETASSGDGAKIIKVFVKDASGNWSV